MSLLFEIIYDAIQDFPYLIRTPHPFTVKIRIIFTWVKINFKFIFLSKFFKFKSENIFGYKINGFNYNTIRYLFKEIFYRHEYFFVSNKKSPIIIDCGANIGFATVFFKWLYPDSQIYAFEADKTTFNMLKKNIFINKLKGVHLFNAAVTSKNGHIAFYFDNNDPGSLVMSTQKKRISQNKTIVKSVSLASFIKENKFNQIDFLKMDIEGSEIAVIPSLDSKKILSFIQKGCIEYHHKISSDTPSQLGKFLSIFENNYFEYQLDTRCFPISAEGKYQDVLIYFYQPLPSSS